MSNKKKINPAVMAVFSVLRARKQQKDNQGTQENKAKSGRTKGNQFVTAAVVIVTLIITLIVMLSLGTVG
ncbi:MAG: hypothetical protein AAFR90_04175 [Pseudomonadota bacterium]